MVEGTAEVTNGEDTFLMAENQSTCIPIGQKHRLSSRGKQDLILIEIRSGSYLGEDDIAGFKDADVRG